MTDHPSIRKTKLRPPVVASDFVPRSRLTEELRAGSAGQLTLVCAPAGFGKTSLVSACVKELDRPVAWVALDERDATPSQLLRLIVAAVSAVVPLDFPEIEPLLASSPSAVELASRLADEIDELEEDVVLVLDELERAGGAAVHDFLAALLEYPPRPLHLVVTTRHDPPWPLASMRARGQLREIRQAELGFTADEAAAFVEQVAGRALAPTAIALLHERTEGWPAAVRMIALALRDSTSADEFLDRLPRGVASVEEFLADAVLARQPEPVRDRMLRISLVERVHADLCDALCPADRTAIDGVALFEHMRRNNLFVSEDDGEWIRLHPLLREHLAHSLSATATDDEIGALHDRARDWFDANGMVGEAIDHALLGTRPDSADDVLGRHRVELMNADRQSEIDAWVRRIRSDTGRNALCVQLLDAWHALPMPELPAALDAIEDQLQTASVDPLERETMEGEVHALRALQLSASFEFDRAAERAAAALCRIPSNATAARANAYFAHATNAQAAGDAAAAHRVVADGIREMSAVGGVSLATVLSSGAFVHWNEGELAQTIALVERALSGCSAREAPAARLTLRTIAGMTHYRRNALDHAEAFLRGSGLDTFPAARHELARTLEAAGRRTEADQVVDDALRQAAGHRGTDPDRLGRALRAELWVRRGDLAPAISWAQDALHEPLGGHATIRPMGIVLAAVFAAAGDEGCLVQADDILDRLLADARRAHRLPIVAEALAIRAGIAATRSDEPAVLQALAGALELTRRGSMARTYLDLAPGVVPFLRHPELPAELRAHARVVAEAAGASREPRTSHSPQVLADDLTDREEDVLELLAERLTNKEIAQRLHIASETVKRHLGNVYGKMHVHGRREAVAKARALGLLPPR